MNDMSESSFEFEANAQNFAELVLDKSHQVPVVVDFWAAWCAPCRSLMPLLAKLAEEYQGKFLLVKVNSDEQQELAAANGIRSLPTVRIFKFGKVVDEFMGAQPEGVLREIIDRHILRETDLLFTDAMAAQQAGDVERTVELLQKLVASDENHKDARVALARIYFEQQRFEEIEPLFRTLRIDLAEDPEIHELKARLQFAEITRDAPAAADLEATIAAEPDNNEARYRWGALKVLQGDYEAGLEQFIDIMRRDRGFRDDGARKAILGVFDILGGAGPLVNRYRAMMASALH